MMKSERLTLRLEPDLLEQISKSGEPEERKPSTQAVYLIRRGLEAVERRRRGGKK